MKYKALFNVLKIPLLFVALMWGVKGIEVYIGTSFFSHGVLPRTFSGLQGILFSPFIHKDFSHLINNTYPLIMLGGMLFSFYKELGLLIFLQQVQMLLEHILFFGHRSKDFSICLWYDSGKP